MGVGPEEKTLMLTLESIEEGKVTRKDEVKPFRTSEIASS